MGTTRFLGKLLACVLGALTLGAGDADAVLVYQFTGEIDHIGSDTNSVLAGEGIGIGTAFSGHFSYDPAAGGLNAGGLAYENYWGVSLSVELSSGQTFSSSPHRIQIVNRSDNDQFNNSATLGRGNTIMEIPIVSGFFNVQLVDFSSTAFDSVGLPTALSLDMFDSPWFSVAADASLSDGVPQDLRFRGTITSLALQSTPPTAADLLEPTTIALFGVGLLGLGMAAQRRRVA